MGTFLVIEPGPFSTIQDRGRWGYQQMGLPVSGALDSLAFRMANLLVGNPATAAVIEFTIVGPQLAVMQEVDVAVTGADMQMKLNYKPVENWTTIRVKPGDLLTFQSVKTGCRAYLAVTGGIDVPEVMGSRSTFTGGRLGGFHGRPLKKGDIVKTGSWELLPRPRRLPESYIPSYSDQVLLHAIPGPQDDFFREGLETLFGSEYTVSEKADRMGYRLEGPPVVQKEGAPQSIISEPTMPGGIQVPADHQPIVLLVEQTVGGYTKIATVISTDIPRIAQATPGDTFRFERCTVEEAHRLYREQKEAILTLARLFG
ncbi:MAG: biotin-dependent carboxyltransferase family protein [Desulfobacterales bacterium]|nr:biotin-dependent carboxyltransferase family protein [Desulfobacterales bacterium]